MVKKDKNPEYVKGRGSKKEIPTRCRICGGQLTDPFFEFKHGAHKKCVDDFKSNVF